MATLHEKASQILAEECELQGQRAFIGKVRLIIV